MICLGDDPREYGLAESVQKHLGQDVLILAPRDSLAKVTARFGSSFDLVEMLPPTLVMHAGRPAMSIPLFMGHRLHQAVQTPL